MHGGIAAEHHRLLPAHKQWLALLQVLVFRGLRVRMGLHAGVGIPGTGGTETKEEDNGDVTLNQAGAGKPRAF